LREEMKSLFLFTTTLLLFTTVHSIIRKRMDREIAPTSIDHSRTAYGDEAIYGAKNAIDMDTSTVSIAFNDPDDNDRIWIRVNLDRVYCIEEIKWFRVNGIDKYFLGDWIKQPDGTYSCLGHVCKYLVVTIEDMGREPTYKPLTEEPCTYGDAVQLEYPVQSADFEMEVAELAVVGRRVDASCEAGYFLGESVCERCGENTYSAEGDNVCTSCPEKTVSPPGSTSENDCGFVDASCEAGYFLGESECEKCGENTYSAEGDNVCTTCPEKTVSPPGSTSENDCGFVQYPTCECWTPECGYCTDMSCTGKTNISSSGLEVTARLKWKKIYTIIFYDINGITLGKLHWSRHKLLLQNCLSCRTPRRLRVPTDGDFSTWTFLLQDGSLKVQVKGVIVYDQKMTKKCWMKYRRAVRFAFTRMSCENSFSYVEGEMELGDKMTPDCNGRCPLD